MILEETAITYRQWHARQRDLDIDTVQVRSEDNEHWPVVVGFWVQGQRFDIFIKDYRAGGTP
jgi:hypothetical protein